MSSGFSPYREPGPQEQLHRGRSVILRVVAACLFFTTLAMPYREHRGCNGGPLEVTSGFDVLLVGAHGSPAHYAWGLMLLALVAFSTTTAFIARKTLEPARRAGVEAGGALAAFVATGGIALTVLFDLGLFDHTEPREGALLGGVLLLAMTVHGAVCARRDILDAVAEGRRERAPPVPVEAFDERRIVRVVETDGFASTKARAEAEAEAAQAEADAAQATAKAERSMDRPTQG